VRERERERLEDKDSEMERVLEEKLWIGRVTYKEVKIGFLDLLLFFFCKLQFSTKLIIFFFE